MIGRPKRSAAAGEPAPLVSVVTIALNAARDLPLTIESVAGQDFADFEYIVVDGQSWDDSFDIYRRYEDVIDRVIEVEDAGVYAAMNHAVPHCRGHYVIFMNAGDCFYSAQALSNTFGALGDERPDVIHGDHVYVDKGLELHKRSIDFALTRRLLLEGRISHAWHDRFPCHQATFTSRALHQRLGGYDTRYDICADHHFMLRAADAGARIRYVDETVAHYFGGGMSALRGERCGIEWIEIYRSHSRHPMAVDRLFSADRLVCHDPQSAATGGKVSGFYPLESRASVRDDDSNHDNTGDEIFSWCAGDGFSVASPGGIDSTGLTLEGDNPGPRQIVTVSASGASLGTLDIPHGPFRVAVSFGSILPSRAVVTLLPEHGYEIEGERFVCFALTHFFFQPAAADDVEPLHPGEIYRFGTELRDRLEPLLRGGWSGIEAAHVWSVGAASHLALPVTGTALELSLVLSGNPFLDAGARKVDISLNGQPLQAGVELKPAPRTITLKLPRGQWRAEGSNFLTLVPHGTAQPPSDPRQLGVCLHSVRLK